MSPYNYSMELLQRAKDQVERYSTFGDKLIADHIDAMECRECEDYLCCGIEAYKWLTRADQTLRDAAKASQDISPEVVESLGQLYRAWLVPCERAEQRIKRQQERGFSIDNLKEFHDAVASVKTVVNRMELDSIVEDVLEGRVFDEPVMRNLTRE